MTRNLLKTLIFSTALLSGCGSFNKEEKDNKNLVEEVKNGDDGLTKEERLVEAFKKMDIQMAKMIAEAKQGGQGAVDFLASDLFLKANDSSMRGDSHTAAYLYKQLLSLKPEDLYIKKKYAVELIRMGSLVEAKLILQDLVQAKNYSDETIGLVLGGVHSALNENDEAQEVYQKLIKIHPSSEEACVFLAKSYAIEKKYKKSHELLSQCDKAEPKAVFSYYRAKIFLQEGKSKTAITHLNKSLKLDPSYHQSAMALGLLKEEKEDFEGAVKVYKKFLEENPKSYPVLSRVVQVLFAQEEYEEVLPYAETLSSLDQDDLNLRVRLGILYTDAKMFDQAIGVFKEILAAVPKSDKILYYLGSLYQQTKQAEMAIEAFSKIEVESPLYVDSSMQIAQILQTLVQLDNQKWEGKFTDFLSVRGEKVEALRVEFQIMLATYFEGLSNYKRAIASLETVTEQKTFTEGHSYYLASLYEKDQRFEDARGIIEKLLVKNPKNAHALNFLGYSLLENSEEIDRAFKLISEAVKLAPNDGYIRDSLGWYYYKVGQLEKALEEIKKASELVDSDVVITKHLAMIYRDLKKYQKAKKYFVEALKNCKQESERNEVMKELDGLQELRLPASSQ